MSFFFLLPNILLSGFMFPFEAMPRPAQWLSQALPLTHFLRIVRGIVLKGSRFDDVATELVWLTRHPRGARRLLVAALPKEVALMARPRSDIQPRIVRSRARALPRRGGRRRVAAQIARDAETNIGMVAYYFPTKDDLFLAVVEEVYAKLVARPGDDPRRR